MAEPDPRIWMWAEACEMLERAERLQRQFFQPAFAALPPANWEPPVDIFENQRELSIVSTLPGVEVEDLHVVMEPDGLLITGIRRLPALAREAEIRRLEIPYGRFERRIRLPTARFEINEPTLVNGCLFVRLTKLR
jgi:HSP20 family protein